MLCAALSACYSPEYRACAITCGTNDACPDGTSCGADGYCHRPGEDMCDAGGSGYAMVAAGERHSCAIDADHVLYCWGDNGLGETGHGDMLDRVNAPTPVDSDDWLTVSAGAEHTCGIKSADHSLWCWGNGGEGQLGNGLMLAYEPRQVGTDEWASVSAGGSHTCAIGRPVASLYCWGGNDNGQLGDDSMMPRDAPVPVADGGATYASVSAGRDHTCAVRSNGDVYCWGDNEYGQLGDGSGADQLTPVIVQSGDYKIVAAAFQHSCSLSQAGDLTCWGSGEDGALGTGGYDPEPMPAAVHTGALWDYVAAGGGHTCAIGRDGAVLCWGFNFAGQVNDMPDNPTNEPLGDAPPIAAGTWKQVALGAAHSCAIDDQGAIDCWGANDAGQLGGL